MRTKIFFVITLLFVMNQAPAQRLVKDLNTGSGDANPSGFMVLGSRLLFSAEDPDHGRELWISDGTESGTFMLKDINTGSAGSDPVLIDTISGRMLFFAESGSLGREMWSTDGTEAGTYMLGDLNTGSGDGCINNLGYGRTGNVYIWPVASSAYGKELFKTDGTPAGTSLLEDICPGSGNGIHAMPGYAAVLDSLLIFTCQGISGSSTQLWRTDGTEAGTYWVRTFDNYPGSMVSLDSIVIFEAYQTTSGYELWQTDGTNAGTTLADGSEINPGAGSASPGDFILTDEILFFTANQGSLRRWYAYFAGSVAGIADVIPGVSDPDIYSTFSNPRHLHCNASFWVANDYIHGYELYDLHDGFSYLPNMIRDINPWGQSIPAHFVQTDCDHTFFTADDGEHGRELWVSDGSSSGTRRLTDIRQGWQSSVYSAVCLMNGELFFAGHDGNHGVELMAVNMDSLLYTGLKDEGEVLITGTYPNPAADYLLLGPLEGNDEEILAEVSSISGQLLISFRLQPDAGGMVRLALSGLESGLYLGRLQTTEKVYSFRFIHQ